MGINKFQNDELSFEGIDCIITEI